MARIFMILNPVAGNIDLDQFRELLSDCERQYACTFDVHETSEGENLGQIARQAVGGDYDIVVAAGGDGTVSGVADALVHNDIPLGIVPVGTGNQLARELSIPIEVPDALALIAGEHSFRCIDVGQLEDRFLLLNVSVGVSPEMMRDADHEAKQSFGFAAYVWALFKELLGVRARAFQLRVDGQPYHVQATEVIVTNAGGLGTATVRLGPDIEVDDGKFMVAVIHAHTLVHYLKLAWDILVRNTEHDPYVVFIPAHERVSIRSARPVPVQADGEVIGETPVEVEVMPRALKVIVPAET